MSSRRFILLVEDNEDQIGSWRADIREFNERDPKPFTVELIVAKNYDEAKAAIKAHHLDAAIVDLRIPQGKEGPQNADSGNQAINDLLASVSGPIAIFSAHVGDVAELTKATPVKCFTKEAGQQHEIISWLCDHAKLMAAIRETVTAIRREAANVFVGAIWPRWDETKKRDLSPDALQQIVTRQVVSHLSEQLSLPMNNAPLYHASEFYFDPPLRTSRLHTGDLLSLDDAVFVILTPQCDIVRTYPEQILLAKCKPIPNWTDNRNKKDFASQNIGMKKHFLPPCGSKGPWTVDFNDLRTVPGSDGDKLLTQRFASVSPQFIPSLVQRFSAFIGRIGSPDIDVASLEVTT